MARFTSTYFALDAPCRWQRGNHHGHSTISDGQDEPLEIIRAYEEEGYHYLAMDYLEGRPLTELIDNRSISAREITKVIAEVCDGLQAAHDAGVIHRDLKPDNVFLTADGARILDFGIAKSTGLDEESSALTRTGHICGTVDYISPEQIRGLSQDPRSDLYAAGVIIYEALTGETPFSGRTVGESLHKVMNDKLVSPRKRSGDRTIPPRV